MPRRHLLVARLVARRALQDYFAVRGPDLAGALAYDSLLTIVPLTAAITVLTSTLFGDAGTGFYRLVSALVPGASAGIVKEIEGVAATARAVSGWGAFLFLGASLRLFFVLEGAANALWGTSIRRSLLSRTWTALVGVVLGPVVAGVLASTLLASGGSFAEFRFTGLALTALLLTLMYRFVPSARVRWDAAIASGFVVGAAVNAVKVVFTRGFIALRGVSKIYGPISAGVIFVLAIGLAWTLLLLGFSLAHAIQFREELLAHDEPEKEAKRAGPLDEAVRMLLHLARAWRAKSGPVELSKLAEEIRRPEDEAFSRLRRLASAGLIVEEGAKSFRLERAPEAISLYAVARAIGESAPRPIPIGNDPTAEALRNVFRRTDREIRSWLQGTSLQDLARVPPPRQNASGSASGSTASVPLPKGRKADA